MQGAKFILALGMRVKYIRHREGFTQSALSKASGLSVGMISRVEGGTRSPTARTLFRIAEVLDIGVSELFPNDRRDRVAGLLAEASRDDLEVVEVFIRSIVGKRLRESSPEAKARKRWRDHCHESVSRAVEDGRLVRPEMCSSCDEVGKTGGHHDDYREPLSVRWLCWSCHSSWHHKHKPVETTHEEMKSNE